MKYLISIRTPDNSTKETLVEHQKISEKSVVSEDKLNAMNIGIELRKVITNFVSTHYDNTVNIQKLEKKCEKWLMKVINKDSDDKPYIARKDINVVVDSQPVVFNCVIIKDRFL